MTLSIQLAKREEKNVQQTLNIPMSYFKSINIYRLTIKN